MKRLASPKDVGQRACARAAVFLRSVVVAVLCVVTQIATSGHWLLVSHSVCPEHGDIVHAHALAPAAERARAAAVEAIDLSDDDHRHGHCTLASQRSDSQIAARPLLPASANPRAVWVAGAPAPQAREQATLSRSTRLLLAPKHSPPPVITA